MASQNALLTQPTNFAALTPSDTADITAIANLGLLIGTGGTIVFRGVYDTADVTYTCQSGQYMAGRFKLVKTTGTTATGIVACSGGRKGP